MSRNRLSRDLSYRLVAVPVLALVISYASGIVVFENLSRLAKLGAFLFFCGVSLWIYMICQLLHRKVRATLVSRSFSYRLGFLLLANGVFTILTCTVAYGIWIFLSGTEAQSSVFAVFTSMSTVATVVFTLLYEVIYLNKEREVDKLVVNQLDQELEETELVNLRNKLDPHFIYNSLANLDHLICTDNGKARIFNEKLGKLYRYFVNSHNKKIVHLSQELDFLREYAVLLGLSVGNGICLCIHVNPDIVNCYGIVPFSLQILLENVVKHNRIESGSPLVFKIDVENGWLVAVNTLRPKQSDSATTTTGLKNLGRQYDIIAGIAIDIAKTEKEFVVKIPLIEL